MKVGLIDVDGHNFPNLALMKLSAWHKAHGDDVEWWHGFAHYDRVYMSKVFDETYTPDAFDPPNADEIIRGGTGYDLHNVLPNEVEHICPDYSLYPKLTEDTAYGFLTRGCPRGCPFCIVAEKEGRASRMVADLSEWWSGQKNIKLLDPNLLACQSHMDLLDQLSKSKAWVDFTQGLDARLLTTDNIEAINRVKAKNIHFAWDKIDETDAVMRGLELYKRYANRKVNGAFAAVYVLTNYNTDFKFDEFRVETLRRMGFDPYVMIYDKPNAPTRLRKYQRYVNAKWIFKSCSFDEYQIRGDRNGETMSDLWEGI